MSDRLTSFSADLSALLASMPGLNTPAVERADWFDRKADLLERATTGNPNEVSELARLARARATELRRGCS